MAVTTVRVEEVELKFPWGTLAGKWWGSKNTRPIVCLHGWQDSAGSFDTLIPLLPTKYSYLALDLPGHGLSSHIPDAMNYNMLDVNFVLNEIMDIYKWDSISLIGHSMGAIISFLFASFFPDKVDLVVALDTLKVQVRPYRINANLMVHRSERVLLADKRNRDKQSEPPSYTYDELIERVYEGSAYSVHRDKANYMLARTIKPSTKYPEKFYFSRDSRVKYMHSPYMEQNLVLELAARIKAPYLFIKSTDKYFSEHPKHIKEAVDVFRRKNPQFEMVRVKGTHHVHLNNPELISDAVSNFLIKHRSRSASDIKSKL